MKPWEKLCSCSAAWKECVGVFYNSMRLRAESLPILTATGLQVTNRLPKRVAGDYRRITAKITPKGYLKRFVLQLRQVQSLFLQIDLNRNAKFS